MFWIGLIIGFFAGEIITVGIIALVKSNGRDDDDKLRKDKSNVG